MKTLVTNSPDEAAAVIKRGGTVAFPTETVYGLGANVFDAAAAAKIFEAKRRPADNPLIAHIANLKQIDELTSQLNGAARKFIDSFFPGPLTIVLRKSERVPLIATAGLDTIGVRMPKHALAHQFLAACGVPVAAPSANLSGRPSPTTWQAVREDLDGRIDCILQGEATEIGLESTVVDCSSDVPVLLRQGAISLDRLRTVVPDIVALAFVDGEAVRSPGLKHKHYSPIARVILAAPVRTTGVSGSLGQNSLRMRVVGGARRTDRPPMQAAVTRDAAFIGVSAVDDEFAVIRICTDIEDYAHQVFEFFRECDRRRVGTIYCEEVPESGIGAALMDRLRRAAE